MELSMLAYFFPLKLGTLRLETDAYMIMICKLKNKQKEKEWNVNVIVMALTGGWIQTLHLKITVFSLPFSEAAIVES